MRRSRELWETTKKAPGKGVWGSDAYLGESFVGL